MTANLPVPGAIDTELAEIEISMRDGRGEYYSGPKTPDGNKTIMEARYLELLEHKETGKSTPDPTPEAEAEALEYWATDGGRAVLNEWEKLGGVEQSAKNSLVLADDLLSTIPPDSRDSFSAKVEALSLNV